MTAPVDVLALLDILRDFAQEDGRSGDVIRVDAVRAAVAELIAADVELDAANRRGGCIEKADAAVRRREALAAVGAAP